MIARWIDWCARNRFLVFTGTVGLVLAGIWAISRIPLDALPDISDVQVIVHTPWNGQPPNIIEDQVTYRIFTGRVHACSNTCNRSKGACPQAFIPPSARMQLERDGFTNTPSWTTTIATAWRIFGVYRTGSFATSWSRFQA